MLNRFFTQRIVLLGTVPCKFQLHSISNLRKQSNTLNSEEGIDHKILFHNNKELNNLSRSGEKTSSLKSNYYLRQYTNELFNAQKRCRLPVTYKNLVQKVLNKMIEENITPNIVTLNTILKGFAKFSATESSLHYLDIFKNFHVQPDLVTYTIIIEGLAKVSFGP